MTFTYRRQAAEKCIHEDWALVPIHRNVLDIDVSRRQRDLRHKQAVISVVSLTGPQHVVEPPKLIESRQIELLRVHPQAHGPIERALENREFPVRLQSYQKQLAYLVGRKSQTQLLLR